MALVPQALPITFSGGIETKQDSKQVPTTKLLTLENATFIKQTTLAKRNGYEALSRLIDGGSSEYGTPVGLGSRDDELLLFTSARCYSYRPSVDRWVDTGEVASVQATEPPIARTGTHQTMPDHATKSGVTAVAWEDSRGGVYASVVESGTGRILLAETLLDASGQSPRCVPCGTVLHIYWLRPSSNRIYVAIVNPVSPSTTPTPSILTDDLSATNAVYDACDAGSFYSSINPAIMAWAQNGGGYRVGYVHPSGVLGSPVTGLASVATWPDTITGPIAIAVDRTGSNRIAVAFVGSVPQVRWLTSTSLTTSPVSVMATSTVATWNRIVVEIVGSLPDSSGIAAWWAGEIDDTRDDLNRIEAGQIVDSGAVPVASETRLLRGHGLVSRAFYDDGHIYALVGHAVQFYPYAACVRISGDNFGGGSVTASFYRSVVGQLPGLPTRAHVASVQPVDPDASGLSRNHAACVNYRIQLDSENGDQFGETGIKLATLDFDAETAYQSVELGRGLWLASAAPQHYDGRRWAEAGFHTAPDVALGVAVVAQGAAGALGAGKYLYRLVYEEIDALGELHQGATSAPFSVTIIASKKINVTIPTYRLTSKRRVRIGVFRSEANAEGTIDTIPFYRVTSLDPTVTGDNGYVANDPTVDSISFVDNMTDAVLLTKEPLYTNGGILSNDPSPMRGDALAGGKSRLFWTDSTEPNVIRYSQERDGEIAVESPIALKLKTDPYGGRVVALGVMDGNVYAFAETSIYGFGGPGPLANPSAGNESFSPPELVTGDVGCKSPNSICQSPVGIVFQSEKGIKLLDRQRQVQDIGADVYRYNDQTVTRATLLPDRHQIVFLTDAGMTLLYNYGAGPDDPSRGQWSTFTNHEGIDARVIGGVYYYLRTDGRVFRETPGQYRDDNSHIPMVIETAWIKMAGYLQGWQRVLWALFLGEWKSSHTLVVRYRIDYNPGYSAPLELDVDSNINPRDYGDGPYGSGVYGNGTEDSTRYQRAIHYNLVGQAIQFRIEDVEPTDEFGASFELSELLLIGGVLDARAKLGKARTN